MPARAALAASANLLHHCLASVRAIWDDLPGTTPTPADIVTVGLALFEDCRQQGLTPDALGLAIPF